jgi:hypothetical protein
MAACATAVIILGCMNFTFQESDPEVVRHLEDGLTCYSGKARVKPHSCLNVYYPAPFLSKPNLELEDTFDRLVVVEEREDGFRINNPSSCSVTGKWKARGLRPVPPPSPPGAPAANEAPAPAPAAPSPELPPQPQPIKP